MLMAKSVAPSLKGSGGHENHVLRDVLVLGSSFRINNGWDRKREDDYY